MPRDVKNAAMQAQAGNATDAAQQYQQNQSLEGNTLMPAYRGLLNGTGPQVQATTAATMGPLGGMFDALTGKANMNAAHTRNDAGTNDLLGQLARTQGSEGAQLSAQNSMQEQQAGLQGMNGLYGLNSDMLTKLLGLQNQNLNTATEASKNPILQSVLGGLAQGAGAGLTGGLGKGLGTIIGGNYGKGV